MKPVALLSHVTQDVRVAVLSLFAAALSACGGDGSNSEPVAVIQQAASAPSSGASQPSSAPIPVTWSTPTAPARVFDYASAATPVSDYTRASRFVLYDNGIFELQLVDFSFGGGVVVYSGRYAEANALITFAWDGASNAGPWSATGTLDGTSLTVQYNLLMQLTDFENAVYVLTP
jgi:hypothetical protein